MSRLTDLLLAAHFEAERAMTEAAPEDSLPLPRAWFRLHDIEKRLRPLVAASEQNDRMAP